jgi:hypothetical protein
LEGRKIILIDLNSSFVGFVVKGTIRVAVELFAESFTMIIQVAVLATNWVVITRKLAIELPVATYSLLAGRRLGLVFITHVTLAISVIRGFPI